MRRDFQYWNLATREFELCTAVIEPSKAALFTQKSGRTSEQHALDTFWMRSGKLYHHFYPVSHEGKTYYLFATVNLEGKQEKITWKAYHQDGHEINTHVSDIRKEWKETDLSCVEACKRFLALLRSSEADKAAGVGADAGIHIYPSSPSSPLRRSILSRSATVSPDPTESSRHSRAGLPMVVATGIIDLSMPIINRLAEGPDPLASPLARILTTPMPASSHASYTDAQYEACSDEEKLNYLLTEPGMRKLIGSTRDVCTVHDVLRNLVSHMVHVLKKQQRAAGRPEQAIDELDAPNTSPLGLYRLEPELVETTFLNSPPMLKRGMSGSGSLTSIRTLRSISVGSRDSRSTSNNTPKHARASFVSSTPNVDLEKLMELSTSQWANILIKEPFEMIPHDASFDWLDNIILWEAIHERVQEYDNRVGAWRRAAKTMFRAYNVSAGRTQVMSDLAELAAARAPQDQITLDERKAIKRVIIDRFIRHYLSHPLENALIGRTTGPSSATMAVLCRLPDDIKIRNSFAKTGASIQSIYSRTT